MYKSNGTMTYVFGSSIAPLSKARGFHASTPLNFYFSTAHSISSSTKLNKPVFTCDEIIKKFTVNNQRIGIITDKRVYIVRDDLTLHGAGMEVFFSTKADKIRIHEGFLITVNKNILYIWSLPLGYSLMLFKRVHKMSRHVRNIVDLDCMGNFVLSVSSDNTVVLTDLTSLKSRVVWRHKHNIRFIKFLSISSDTEYSYIIGSDNRKITVKENEKTQAVKFEGKFITVSNVKENFYSVASRNPEDNDKYFVYLFHGNKEMIKKEFDQMPLEMSLCIDKTVYVVIRFKNSIQVMCHLFNDLETLSCYSFFDSIKSFSTNNFLLGIGDNQNNLFIYDKRSKKMLKELQLKSSRKNTSVLTKLSNNTLFSVTVDGELSVYNLTTYHCYRQFQLPVSMAVEQMETSEDSQLVILQSGNSLMVYNVRKNNLVFTFNHSCPIIKFQFFHESIYFIDLEYSFIHLNVFSDSGSTTRLIDSAQSLVDFRIHQNKIFIAKRKEIEIYSTSMDYIGSFGCEEEIINFSVGYNLVVVNNKTAVRIYYNHNLIDTLLFRNNVVYETDISATDGELLIKTNDGISFYRQQAERTIFYNNDVKFINQYLENDDYVKAFVTALQLKDANLFVLLLNRIQPGMLKDLIRMLCAEEVVEFYQNLKMLTFEADTMSIRHKIVLSIKYLYFYHKNSLPSNESDIFNSMIFKHYRYCRNNYYMLKVLKEKKE